jgi:hypothetical protein
MRNDRTKHAESQAAGGLEIPNDYRPDERFYDFVDQPAVPSGFSASD